MGAMAMYGVATFDRAWNQGEIFLPWVDFLPTDSLNLPVQITLSDSGEVPMARRPRHRPGDGRADRAGRPLPRVPAAAPRRAARQGGRLARPRPVPAGRRPAQLRHELPDAEVGRSPTSAPFDNFLGLGNPFPRNSLFAFFAAVIVGAVVWALYQYTRFGMATRAAASNEKGAVLLGYSPQRLAATNWVIASIVATLAAILVGPIQGPITPVGLTALIVPALAAALIGGLKSVPITIAGGIALGHGQLAAPRAQRRLVRVDPHRARRSCPHFR